MIRGRKTAEGRQSGRGINHINRRRREDGRRPAGVRAVRLLHGPGQLQQRRMGRRHLRPQGTVVGDPFSYLVLRTW
jgi:hypothetical protein